MRNDDNGRSQPKYDLPPRVIGAVAACYTRALLQGRPYLARRLVFDLLGKGVDVRHIYLDLFQQAQHELGRLWQSKQIGVAEEHYCTAATQQLMAELCPLTMGGAAREPTVVAACVVHETHEMGLRMVADFFDMEGWSVHYLGANLPAPEIVEAVRVRTPDVLALSATMAANVEGIAAIVRTMRALPQGKELIVLAGGRPFNQMPDLWSQVGADGTGHDARQAVATAKRLLEARGDFLPQKDRIPLG